MDNNLIWQKRIRNWAGFLGMILPWVSLAGAFLVQLTNLLCGKFWKDFSRSGTYYITPALSAILTAASLVRMCYDGYSMFDSLISVTAGIFGLLIVLFPCRCAVSTDIVGFFQVPVNLSSAVHCTSATIFFCLLAFMILFLFTRSNGTKTKQKKMRNKIYLICGIGMLTAMVLMPLPVKFYAKTWWIEMISLSFFGFAWLVKGGTFKFLND